MQHPVKRVGEDSGPDIKWVEFVEFANRPENIEKFQLIPSRNPDYTTVSTFYVDALVKAYRETFSNKG